MPIYEVKEELFKGLKNYFHYLRNYVTSGSGIAGCDCIFCQFSLDLTKRIVESFYFIEIYDLNYMILKM